MGDDLLILTRQVKGGNMQYILVTTVRNRKNAKRHIVARSTNINELRNMACNDIDEFYRCFIYTGNWKLVEEV